jgi:hypothetical protein
MTELLVVFHFVLPERSAVETVSELRVFLSVVNMLLGRSGSVMQASVSSAARGNCSSPDDRTKAYCSMFISWQSRKKQPVKSVF